MPRRRLALLATAVAAAAAMPAPAGAALVRVPDPCPVYWPGQGSRPIGVTVAGLAPNQEVRATLEVRGRTAGGAPLLKADEQGSLVARVDQWNPELGRLPKPSASAAMVVRDLLTGAVLGHVPLRVANVGVRVDTSPRPAGAKRRWEISGLSRFGGQGTYWAHYFDGDRWFARQRLGRPTGRCGYLRTHRPLMPFRRSGEFRMLVQASRSYRDDLPSIGGVVRGHR